MRYRLTCSLAEKDMAHNCGDAESRFHAPSAMAETQRHFGPWLRSFSLACGDRGTMTVTAFGTVRHVPVRSSQLTPARMDQAMATARACKSDTMTTPKSSRMCLCPCEHINDSAAIVGEGESLCEMQQNAECLATSAPLQALLRSIYTSQDGY